MRRYVVNKNVMIMEDIVSRIKAFIEYEARSCSMDFGCVTPEYVFRMWGGRVSLEEIAVALHKSKKQLGL